MGLSVTFSAECVGVMVMSLRRRTREKTVPEEGKIKNLSRIEFEVLMEHDLEKLKQ